MPNHLNQALSNTQWIARTAVLLALTVALQMLGLPQPVTGPAVNAMLLLAAMLVGMGSGVFVGVFTPVIAFYRGILPPVLAPMVPFIAISNALFVIVFVLLRSRNVFLALGVAAVVKFAVLATAVRVFVPDVPPPVAAMMGTPQLITAIAGGLVALAVYRLVIRARGQR